MKYQIKIPIKIKTTNDETKLLPGQIIILPEDRAEMLLSEGKIITIRQAFEDEYKSFSRWLRRYPLCYLDLKEHKLDTYDAFMEMNRTIDKLCLQEDYKGFREAIELYKKEHLRIVLEGNASNDRGRNREHYFEPHF